MDHLFHTFNRQKIVQATRGGLTVLSAYTRMQRGNDAAFAFEQEANFWYLSGIEAPDWWLIIDGVQDKSWLVMPKVSQVQQIFDGSLDANTAQKISGVDGVLTQNEAMTMLRALTKSHKTVYTIGDHPQSKYYSFVINPAQKLLQKRLRSIFKQVQDCRPEIAKLRAIKQPIEIEAIKKAVNLTVDAFKDIKKKLPKMRYEYEVEAEFSYYFRKHGCQGHSYDPIVASGKNACTLHYNANNDKIKPRSILLMDVGARVDGYAADITRSFAIGDPTERQRQVHRAVEDAQNQIIELLHPGLKIATYHAKVDVIMQDALINLGLLSTRSDQKTYRKYFPHGISHGLGIDVHDSLGQPSKFLPGMVLTVEPGIYIPEEAIGVRIEDDILITNDGYTNFSQALSTSL